MKIHHKDKTKEELNQPVTLGVLLEYTDGFLIPKFVEIIDERVTAIVDDKIDSAIGKQTHELKSYIDRKLSIYA